MSEDEHRAPASTATDTGNGLLIRRLDHVGIAVKDVDTAISYYTKQLGLSVVHDEIADDPGVRLCYIDAGNSYIQLVQPVRDGPVRDFIEARGEGLHHVCFTTDSLDDVVRQMPGQAETQIFRAGRGRRACFLSETPEGVTIELTETEPTNDDSDLGRA